MKTYFIFFILNIIGGLICCAGDCLLDLKGKENRKLGTTGNIDSAWSHMAEWRFGLSILCATVAEPCVGLGFYSVYSMLCKEHTVLAYFLGAFSLLGCTGGLFIHAFLCLQAILYKRITENDKDKRSEEEKLQTADHALNGLYKAIYVPFFSLYIALMAADLCVAIAAFAGYLGCPRWMGCLNSVFFLIIGVTLRKLYPKKFYDLPGIIMPSLGLAMIGVIGIAAL